jgi:uncharacterized membrane protein YfcA
MPIHSIYQNRDASPSSWLDMLTFWIFSIFVTGGLAAGFLTGLLGIGGGAVMVPILYHSFLSWGWEPRVAVSTAIATSLSVMIFSGARTSWEYRRQGLIDWGLLRWVVLGSIVGTASGAHMMLATDEHMIRLGFGLLMWLLALLTLSPVSKLNHVVQEAPDRRLTYLAVGILAGLLAAMFGVGGGAIMVPALVLLARVSIHKAIASSAAAIVFSALLSTSDYVYQGWSSHSIEAGALGWIFLPAMLILGGSSLFSVPYGTKLAQRLAPQSLKYGLATLQAGIGIKIIFFG